MTYNLTSTIIKHTQCPSCAKKGNDNHKDNLGVYNDGHSYCFACGFFLPIPSSIQSLTKKIEGNSTNNFNDSSNSNSNYNEFYQHCTTNFSPVVLRWLAKYDISKQEAIDNNLYYDLESELLKFPIKDPSGKIVGFNGRNFGSASPKYISKGDLKQFPQFLMSNKECFDYIYTEDFLSAIKISRQFNACPLFGTKLHKNYLTVLPVRNAPNLILWLDFDKALESIKQTQYYQQFFPNTFSLVTKKDPKEYTDKEINAFVLDCISRST